MTYKQIRQILDNVRKENKRIDSYVSEYNRMKSLLEIEQQKINPNKNRIIAICNHLKTIKDINIDFNNDRIMIYENINNLKEPYSTILIKYFFDKKNYAQIELEMHYPETTLKKYIERAIKQIEENLKNEIK